VSLARQPAGGEWSDSPARVGDPRLCTLRLLPSPSLGDFFVGGFVCQLAPGAEGSMVETLALARAAWLPTLACLLTGAKWHGCLGGFTGFFPGHVSGCGINKNLINRQFKPIGMSLPNGQRSFAGGSDAWMAWTDSGRGTMEWQQGRFTLSPVIPERIQLDVVLEFLASVVLGPAGITTKPGASFQYNNSLNFPACSEGPIRIGYARWSVIAPPTFAISPMCFVAAGASGARVWANGLVSCGVLPPEPAGVFAVGWLATEDAKTLLRRYGLQTPSDRLRHDHAEVRRQTPTSPPP